MENLIAKGRGNQELRQWLSDWEAIGCRSFCRGAGRLHIAFCLDDYCREVYGMRSFKVLSPETSLPLEDKLAFPAQYFGPYEIPVYEDGSLKRRPCPWATRPKLVAALPPAGASALAAYDWRKIALAMRDPGYQMFLVPNNVFEQEDPDFNPPSTTIIENLNAT